MKMGALVLAYHGCDLSVGEGLLSGKSTFRSSVNDHDWLGHGIYFWENNPQRAMDWARFMASHPRFKNRVKKPFAVGAVIDLGNSLDLTEAISLGIVKEAYEDLSRTFRVANVRLPENKPVSAHDEDLIQRFLDCAVINHAHKLSESAGREPFSTVRGAFHEGEPLYPGAAIRRQTHIQLCVRDSRCIRGIFRIPETEMD